MLKRISHTFIHVLDQDEALDFYVGKLGMVVHTDADLGVMRFLTVNLPDQPDVELVLMLPGPPAYDDATAAEIRELVTKGAAGGGRDLPHRRLPRHLREPAGERRRVHPRADGALLRDRLRAARSLREPDPLHPAAGGTDRRAIGRGAAGAILTTATSRGLFLPGRSSPRPLASRSVRNFQRTDAR